MGQTEQSLETPDNGLKRGAVAGRLGAGAVALLLAATLAACGSSDSLSDTTSAADSAPATQAATPAADTATETTADAPADNGIAGKPAEEILSTSLDAARGASSVHVVGAISGVSLDLSLASGEGASGSITQGPNRFELIAIGREIYIRGSDDFYRSLGGDAAVRLLGDKWLKVPATGRGFESFAEFTDMGTMLDEILRLPAGRRVEAGEVETVDGAEVVPLNARTGTLYIAATGDPLPVKLVGRAGRDGQVTFDGWNEPVELTAPADAIDIAQLSNMR